MNINSGTRYEIGQSVYIRAYTNSNFVFKGWLLDGEPYQGAQSMNFTVDESDHTLTALYEYSPSSPSEPSTPQLEHSIFLKANPADGGYFNISSPYKVKAGEGVYIQTTPNQYYSFTGWSSEDMELDDPSARSFYFVMPDHNVTFAANFSFNYDPFNPAEPSLPAGSSTLYGRRVSTPPGQAVAWPIYLENYSEVVSVAVDVAIPDGFIADIPGARLSERAAAHTLAIEEVDAGKSYRFNIRGTEPLKGVNGALFTLPIAAPADAEVGSVHTVGVSKGVIYKSDGSTETIGLRDGAIIIAPVPDVPVEAADLAVTSVSVDKAALSPGDSFDVSWSVSNVGQLAAAGGWTERIALVDESGYSLTIATTAYDTDNMAPGDIALRSASVNVPKLPGIDGKLNVRVTLTASAMAEEPDDRLANNVAMTSGLPISLSKMLVLSVPESPLVEGSTVTARCQLARSGGWGASEEFAISVSGDARLSAPASVLIPKNQSAAYFYLTLADNDINDDSGDFSVTVSGAGYDAVSASVAVEDDELPALKVVANPEDITEGESLTLTISASRAPAQDLQVNITSNFPKRLSLPSSVILPAGQTSVEAVVQAIDNSEIETVADITFKVSAPGYSPAETYVFLYDNDVPSI
ncbi:MAG: hypothetical protein NC548_65000, partial [Lachnospiraceae bacterium]|nr:hypothetical protein [Lachnospiraceae bacterium]